MVALRSLVMALPAVLLTVAGLRNEGQTQLKLWVGACFLGACFLLLAWRGREQPIGQAALLLYLVGLAWLWSSRGVANEWFFQLAQALLLVIPLTLFALQTLRDSGAIASRRANLLAQRLAERKKWPAELKDCRTLPEVKALRESLAVDASPALNLLHHPSTQVRMAALAALEFRMDWGPNQAEMVLRFAQETREPLLRAAAVMALANIDDRILLEKLTEFLRDPAIEVRRAATEALLWDSEKRWGWIRQAVHQALADPVALHDGAMISDGPPLSANAVEDLLAWAAEKGPIALRAAQTLGANYNRVLAASPNPATMQFLKQQLGNPQTPPTLRMEVAQALRAISELDHALLDRLLDQANPSPLRLLAAEELLAGGPHAESLAALRDIARMSNREMALSTADVVQRRLGVDMGLALNQPLPLLHSRQAADVMRRLMKWAEQPDDEFSNKSNKPESRKRGSDSGTFHLPSGLK
jgi:hypothetical protein